MSKNDMIDRICTLSNNDLKDLVKTYRIPIDLHPRLPGPGFTMDRLPADPIDIYYEFLWFFGVRVPFSTFLLSVLKYFKMREEVLVRSGLSYVWFNKECDLVFRRINDNAEMNIYDFITLPSWSDSKIVEESYHLPLPLLERVPSYTTASAAEGAMVSLPNPDEIFVSLSDPRLAKKSKGPVQARVHLDSEVVAKPSQMSKKRKLKRKASKVYSNAPKLGQAKGMDDANLTDFHAKIEDSLEKDEGASTRAASAPIPRLGKRLGAPLSMDVVSASKPSHVWTSTHAFISGCAAISGHAEKSEAEVLRRQVDLLDFLARSALARDVEYDQIPEDDFGTATRGEEIDLTLFPLTPGLYHKPYPCEGVSSSLYTKKEWDRPHAPKCNILCKDNFKDLDVCRKALDRKITPAELRRTESLLPLVFSNHVNVLSAMLVSHAYELNSRYTNLVSSNAHLQEKLDKKKGDVTLLRSKVTSLDNKLENLQRGCDALGQENRELRSHTDVASEEIRKLRSQLTDAKTTSASLSGELTQTDAQLSEQALTVRDLQNELFLEKSKSQGYKDAMDGLREEATQFVGSGVESLVQKFLSSDEFHAALACVPSLGINYGVKRGYAWGAPMLCLKQLPRKSLTSTLLFIEELSWEGKDFVLPPFHWRTYVFLYFTTVVAYYFIRREFSNNVLPYFLLHVTFPQITRVPCAWYFCIVHRLKLIGMPISAGMTASVSYARLNGVSPLLILGVVLWGHNTFGDSSTHAPPSWCNLILIPYIML
nr:hypothetical protein [Tanacetum cinerariifolium]